MITVGQQWIDNLKRTRGRVLEVTREYTDFYQLKVVRNRFGDIERSQVGRRVILGRSRILNDMRLLRDEERIGG